MTNPAKPVPQLTLNNHFSYGYVNDSYQVKLGPLTRKPMLAAAEGALSAQHIFDNNNSMKVQLCLSGGIDSEALLNSFLKTKQSFEIYFLRFKDDFNDYDINSNIKLCNDLSLTYKFIDLDILRFFESGEYLKYGQTYKCQSPQIAAHLWLCDQLDGLPVFSGNPIMPTFLNDSLFFMGLP